MPVDQSPRVVGPYRILRPLGSGAMAVVWVAEHRKLRRRVALKRLNLHDSSPEASERFERESRIAASLQHPRIVAVHDYLEHDGSPYIVMELVPGGTLRSLIGHLTQEQTFAVLADVLEALVYTEEREVVHRDIKPDNVLVATDGRVKLADFGIAKLVGDGPDRLTASGIAVGTPEYMAPEQATAEAVSAATDLYAVGMLAYHLLAGRTPFEGEASPASLMFRHVNEIPQRLDFVDPSAGLRAGRLGGMASAQGAARAPARRGEGVGRARADRRAPLRSGLACAFRPARRHAAGARTRGARERRVRARRGAGCVEDRRRAGACRCRRCRRLHRSRRAPLGGSSSRWPSSASCSRSAPSSAASACPVAWLPGRCSRPSPARAAALPTPRAQGA